MPAVTVIRESVRIETMIESGETIGCRTKSGRGKGSIAMQAPMPKLSPRMLHTMPHMVRSVRILWARKVPTAWQRISERVICIRPQIDTLRRRVRVRNSLCLVLQAGNLLPIDKRHVLGGNLLRLQMSALHCIPNIAGICCGVLHIL